MLISAIDELLLSLFIEPDYDEWSLFYFTIFLDLIIAIHNRNVLKATERASLSLGDILLSAVV